MHPSPEHPCSLRGPGASGSGSKHVFGLTVISPGRHLQPFSSHLSSPSLGRGPRAVSACCAKLGAPPRQSL
eukprot:3517795-Alexandrium_andersonii.AAC.1